jgi:thiamine-monophosphate kinase
MHEFELIKHYFASQVEHRSDVLLGIGDDAALVKVKPGHELVITTDTLVEGIHFPQDTLPYDIGHKSLAVNLSDLAAMGATPAWVTMALTLPHANQDWIQAFCTGFFNLAHRFNVQLIGGDLTRGPLSITVQALGLVPAKKARLRSLAKAGDLIYVSGTVGDAGLALKHVQKKIQVDKRYEEVILTRLNRPEPRLALGEQLRDIAHALIDISDGLAADLGHILEQSGVGGHLYVDQLPLSDALRHTLASDEAIALALTAGDDYELCFTLAPEKRVEWEKKQASLACPCTYIGEVSSQPGLVLGYQDGRNYHGLIQGYQHF